MEPPVFVPETIGGIEPLEQFRGSGVQKAFVMDEYGALPVGDLKEWLRPVPCPMKPGAGSRCREGVDSATHAMEVCAPMFIVLRALAPAVFLLALLSGHAATGMVIAHVAHDHAVMVGHEDHHGEAEGEHHEAERGSEHTHRLLPTTAAAPARIACPSIVLQACLAVVRQERFALPDGRALTCSALPWLRAGPLEPPRHSILLL